ncbi:hypothetical protein ABT095_12245 [Kitasatospora sp. NPDC002227]|uniref:hypothetical protein n=1 Tax=Kitasatospora sp. NPDC002227 TaxID=3154773 RepID=UPI00331FB33E
MSIKWAALAQTAGVSVAVTVAVVAVFAVGIMALSTRETALAGDTPNTTKAGAALATAGVCFAACAAVVLYGLSLIAA